MLSFDDFIIENLQYYILPIRFVFSPSKMIKEGKRESFSGIKHAPSLHRSIFRFKETEGTCVPSVVLHSSSEYHTEDPLERFPLSDSTLRPRKREDGRKRKF